MADCKIKKYIEELPVSQKEKYRLDDLHNQIGEDALKTGGFRKSEGSIYSIKDKFNLASRFIVDKNQQLGEKVTRLLKTTNNNFLLESDVTKLAEYPANISYDNLLVLSPSTTVSEEEFNNLSDEEQEVLIYQAKNC